MIRSLAVAIRSLRVIGVGSAVVALLVTPNVSLTQTEYDVSSVVNQESDARDMADRYDVSDLEEQAKKIRSRSAEIVGDLRPTGELWMEAKSTARALMEQINRENPTLQGISKQGDMKAPSGGKATIIFASMSLGEVGLREILEAASHDTSSLVVFRGIPKDMNLGKAILSLQKLVTHLEPVPNVVLNPELFRDYAVDSVPTIIQLDDAPGPGEISKVIARVEGISNTQWLKRQVANGATGHLGVRGPVENVSEKDLIEMARDRAAQIDWESKKEDSLANFWRRRNFHDLPYATSNRVRELDPSVKITRDIVSPDGTVVVAQGDYINPLEKRDFTSALVVFNPTRKEELATLDVVLPELLEEYDLHRTTLIATRMDRLEGWEGYKAVTGYFNAPVYLLTPDLIERFELERTPTVVTAKEGKFIIHELAPEITMESPAIDGEYIE